MNVIFFIMIKVMFPGTFDPPTLGHLDIIERCSKLFDHVTVLVAEHEDKQKMFSINKRVELINDMIKDFSNVTVDYYDGLVVKYAEHNNIKILVRGIRNSVDYAYESELEKANSFVSSKVETLFLNSRHDLTNIKSSLVKELFKYSVDISSLVTHGVYQAMKADKNYIDKKTKMS